MVVCSVNLGDVIPITGTRGAFPRAALVTPTLGGISVHFASPSMNSQQLNQAIDELMASPHAKLLRETVDAWYFLTRECDIF